MDAVDGADDVAWAGADPAATAERFGCAVAEARASTVAAIRETFEETGVLLTRPPHSTVSDGMVSDGMVSDGTVSDGMVSDGMVSDGMVSDGMVSDGTVSDADAALLATRRRQVEAHELAFTALLDEFGLAVDADLIRPWARWITPPGEPRRYDTFFYVAALPPGARAHAETTEAIEAQLDPSRPGAGRACARRAADAAHRPWSRCVSWSTCRRWTRSSSVVDPLAGHRRA